MNKVIISLVLILISISVLLILSLLFSQKNNVVINQTKFDVSVAKSDDQKAKGLSIYKSLENDKGMIFVFDKVDYYPFWMKGMKFSIDIIYIRNDRITEIFKDVPYPKNQSEKIALINPTKKANYVLEINSGLSDKYNFKEGDKIKINL